MSILKEFKEFSVKGNVLDLAIGVIIGNAFGKVVTSFVNDIIMPPIGMALGKVNFNSLKIVLHEATSATDKEVAFNYGAFLQVITDFLIISACIFMFVRIITKVKTKFEKEQLAQADPTPDKQEVLLTEIRDLLKDLKDK